MGQDFRRKLIEREQPGTLRSPGCQSQYFDHPGELHAAVEVGVVFEHRFAFSYWAKFTEKLRKRGGISKPSLLTIDWHDDVGGPDDYVNDELRSLDISDGNEVGLFCWYGLRPINDGHIAPALYLDMFNDVFVVLKQHQSRREGRDTPPSRKITDLNGMDHSVYFFSTTDELFRSDAFLASQSIYLDFDLDYFRSYDGNDFPSERLPLVDDSVIRSLLATDGDLMKHVLPKLAGLTIALEPEYCGGWTNCMSLFGQFNDLVFDGTLFEKDGRWALESKD